MISLRFGGDPAATIECIASRDLDATLECAKLGPPTAFVWPETYKKIYRRQVLEPDIPGFPVVMRGMLPVMIDKYGGTKLAMKAFERWVRLYRVTIVDRSAYHVWKDNWPRFTARFQGLSCISRWPVEQLKMWRHSVFVNGRLVPLDKERIEQLAKAVKLVEKIEKLAA